MYFYENWDNIYKAKVAICQVKFSNNFSNFSKFGSSREKWVWPTGASQFFLIHTFKLYYCKFCFFLLK